MNFAVFRLLVRGVKPVGLSIAVMLAAAGCATQNQMVVESANQDTRVRVVVIHHTTADFQQALDILTEPSDRPVSSHYLIPEPDDPSYPTRDLRVYTLVPEERRAWHAGVSYWAGKTALNDMSIGIELVNQAYCQTPSETGNSQDMPAERGNPGSEKVCFYPDYADSQLALLVGLLEEILARHTAIKPTHIVGHSDIAPQRKVDPGPRFPWQRLYRLGYGAWYDDETVIRYWEQFRKELPPVLTLQTALHTYGYGIEPSGQHDSQSRNVVQAFQMHFLPWQVTGEFSADTVAVLYALLDKYYPSQLELLLQGK